MRFSDYKFCGIIEFIQVVESGTFTAASQMLGVSKSHVSKQITSLEQHLDTRLFHRSTRTLTLTDAGKLYYDRCLGALNDLNTAAQEITQVSKDPQGTLKITAPVTLGEFFIASLLSDFAIKYPNLKVDFHLSTRNVSIIEEGFDLAVRLGHLEDSSYIARSIASIEYCVSGSQSYLDTHGIPETLESLAQHNCLICSTHGPQAGGVWKFAGKHNGDVRERKVKGNWSCNNCYGLMMAARKGLGLIWLPDVLVADDIIKGNLQTILDDYRLPSTVWAVYPTRKHVPAKVNLFVEYLAEAFTHNPPWKR